MLKIILHAAVAVTLVASSAAFEVKPISEETATEYQLDRTFFQKGTMVQDILIATSEKVSDFTHLEAAYQFDMMMKTLVPEVAQRIRDQKVLCILVAYNELTSDVPQFKSDKSGRELDFYNWRQRGFLTRIDGRPTVLFAEEDVMEYEGGMQIESILIHEFGHVIHGAGFDDELKREWTEAFEQAKSKGLWNDGRAAQRFRRVKGDVPVSLLDSLVKAFPKETPELLRACLDSGDITVNGKAADASVKVTGKDQVLIVFGGAKDCYASKNRGEYFAEGVQCWFDTNRTMDHDHNHIHTRGQLKGYDTGLAKLCEKVLGDSSWRFVSPRLRAGKDHLKGYDPSQSPVVVKADFIEAAALDYYDEYWSGYWQRLRDKHALKSASGDPAPSLEWRLQRLHRDHNEGAAIGDIDGDGALDISAGEYWYAAPKFTQRKLRSIAPFGKDYLQNNGEHLYDMNGDGLPDVISGRFTETRVFWYENPGKEALAKGDSWPEHLLMDTATGSNEVNFFRDMDGDAVPEWLENSWVKNTPMLLWKLKGLAKDATPGADRHVVGDGRNGHGMGFGDINGDGREDIVFMQGWYEQPAGGPFSGPWTYHGDFELPQACCPVIVADLNRDGRNDILWAAGHDYGLFWEEQLEPTADGGTVWRHHLIDKSFSQAHALAWEDIDNDGAPELITGKRYFAHSGKDPGAKDPNLVVYYDFNPDSLAFTRHTIAEAPSGEGPGIGLQIRIADLDGNGWKDIVVPGKSGTYILWNRGFPKQ